jgi:glyoxylase-like metal-dependent hydrolase (beta-lactamase superfamily II)
MENLLTITVKSTHFYLIDIGRGKLLVDAGWAELLPRFTAELKKTGVRYDEIKYVMFTHSHPDHAGLVQSVKRLSGACMIIHANQIPFLPALAKMYLHTREFEPITVAKGDLVSPDRAALAAIGIHGEIVPTPGHSSDSVSLVLDSGMAFIGDLHLPSMVTEESLPEIQASWAKLKAMHAEHIYPAHGAPFRFSEGSLIL